MNKKLNCILLIDDDEATNFLNKMTVEQIGCSHHVQEVQGGQEALDYLQRKGKYAAGAAPPPPDLIFLDINMPSMDGWEFLTRYRELPQQQRAGIILIMLTTSLNPDYELRTKAIPEIAGFENKPLKQPQLEVMLSKYFKIDNP